jgi:hypothetical protein
MATTTKLGTTAIHMVAGDVVILENGWSAKACSYLAGSSEAWRSLPAPEGVTLDGGLILRLID